MRYTAAVLTISDKGARGERVDTSGPTLCRILEQDGWDVVYTTIIPDERAQIQAELILGNESSYNRMSGLGKSLLIREEVIPLEEELKKIQQVTVEDVQAFFKKYIQKERCGISIVGNVTYDQEEL